jgi:hypothetical protein
MNVQTIAALCLLPCCILSSRVSGQVGTVPPPLVQGVVHGEDGRPLDGVTVLAKETLQGTITDSAGVFSFDPGTEGAFTLRLQRAGFDPLEQIVAPRAGRPLLLVLRRTAILLEGIEVRAGEYRSGTSVASVTPLDVVMTPGAEADVTRALQTLPGVQTVDEGTALHTRGGAIEETRVLVNGAEMVRPARLRSALESYGGTVDPFVLDEIYFSTGGFGARFGNALSGMVSLRTQGRPERPSLTFGAGLAAASLAVSVPFPRGGARIATNAYATDILFWINGSSREFVEEPRGFDRSANLLWQYGRHGEVKLFSVHQGWRVGLVEEEFGARSTYSSAEGSNLSVLSWSDIRGPFVLTTRLARATARHDQLVADDDLGAEEASWQWGADVGWSRGSVGSVRAGAEWEDRHSRLTGSLLLEADSGVGEVPRHSGAYQRLAAYAEVERRAFDRLTLQIGVRSDDVHAAVLAPRAAASLTLSEHLRLTAAWGVYHQAASPLLDRSGSGRSWPLMMTAAHQIAGFSFRRGNTEVRVEGYRKEYAHLAQRTERGVVHFGGTGWARGLDLLFRSRLPAGLTMRTSLSAVRSRRTDPGSGLLTRAPADVPVSAITILERYWSTGWQVGLAHRFASGRPYTPVESAAYDSAAMDWAPIYGKPMSERLPRFHRADISVSHVRQFGSQAQLVCYASMTNVLNAKNVFRMAYDPVEEMSRPVRSMMSRSIYLGLSLELHQ